MQQVTYGTREIFAPAKVYEVGDVALRTLFAKVNDGEVSEVIEVPEFSEG